MGDKIFSLLYKAREETSLSDLLKAIKICPKNIYLHIFLPKKWKYGHSLVAIKQLEKEVELKKNKVSFYTEDSLIKKMFLHTNLSLIEELDYSLPDFFKELYPQKVFKFNKTGEIYSDSKVKLVKIIKENEQLKIWHTKIKEMTFTNKVLLGFSVFLSLGLLSFLLALIIPQATVEITPKKKSLKTVVNLNFIKTEENYLNRKKEKGNNFYVYPLDFTFKKEIVYPVLSKIFEGTNAKGVVTLYNNYKEPITLKNGTRLQTENGLIFKTTHYIRIPPFYENEKKELVPGKARVEVEARSLDLYQNIIGTRGNIEPTNFKIPGLTTYMQKFIWGESKEKFEGGVTKWKKECQETDIISAKEKLVSELNQIAEIKVDKFIKNINKEDKINLKILPIKNHLKKELISFERNPDILGKNIDNFLVKGEMKVLAYVFYQDRFKSFIQNHLEEKSNPEMELEKIEFSNLKYNKFNETPLEIRVAVNINARQSYDFNPETKNGKKLNEQIKSELIGMRKEEALKWLHNNSKIHTAKINIFPPLKKHLPLIKKHIYLKKEEKE
jgi:hypothetical protein